MRRYGRKYLVIIVEMKDGELYVPIYNEDKEYMTLFSSEEEAKEFMKDHILGYKYYYIVDLFNLDTLALP